jgi:hypothetical protein
MSQLWDICQPVRTLAENMVRIRCQETTSEDMGDFMCATAAVVFGGCKTMRLLQLLLVRSRVYKWSENQVTNPNLSVVTHTHYIVI